MNKVVVIVIAMLALVVIIAAVIIVVIVKLNERNSNKQINSLIQMKDGKEVGSPRPYSSGNGLLYGESCEMQTILTDQTILLILQATSSNICYCQEVIDYIDIGREPVYDDLRFLCIPNSKISRKHCRVHREGKNLYVLDLNSTNHTYLNGRRIIDSVQLKTGDILSIGTITFQVRIDS